MVDFYFQTYQSLNYSWIVDNGQLVNILYWFFKFIFPVEKPTVFLGDRFEVISCQNSDFSCENIAGYHIFNAVGQLINKEIKSGFSTFRHLANLHKNIVNNHLYNAPTELICVFIPSSNIL